MVKTCKMDVHGKSDASVDTSPKRDSKIEVNGTKIVTGEVVFEDALNLSGIGMYNYRLLVLSIYTLLAAMAEIFSVGLLVTLSQCDLGLGVEEKGIISSVPILGIIASAHFWGYLADTKGRQYTLKITITGTVVTSLLSSFSNHWIFMTFSKFLSAIFACGTNAVIFTLLGESTLETHRRQYLLYASTGIMFTQAAITLLAYPILQLSFAYYIPFLGFYYRPWRLLVQTIALINALNLVLIVFYVFESPKFYFSKGDHDNGLDVLKNIYAVNTGKSPKSYVVKRVVLDEDENETKKGNFFKLMWNQTVPLFQRKHLKNTLLIFGISIPTYCITPPVSVWLPFIFNSYSNSDSSNMTFCHIFNSNSTSGDTTIVSDCDDSVADFTFAAITGFAFYLTMASVISVIVIKYVGKKWMYVSIHVVTAGLAILIDFVSVGWGMVTLIGMMSNVVCMGITTTYAVELFPTYMRAMAVGLSMMVARAVSFIFFKTIGSQLFENCENFLIFLGFFILSGAIIGLFLPQDKKLKDTNVDKEFSETYRSNDERF